MISLTSKTFCTEADLNENAFRSCDGASCDARQRTRTESPLNQVCLLDGRASQGRDLFRFKTRRRSYYSQRRDSNAPRFQVNPTPLWERSSLKTESALQLRSARLLSSSAGVCPLNADAASGGTERRVASLFLLKCDGNNHSSSSEFQTKSCGSTALSLRCVEAITQPASKETHRFH